MKHYKFDEQHGIVQTNGWQFIQLVANSHCSKSFRRTAGKELAKVLNAMERKKKRKGAK